MDSMDATNKLCKEWGINTGHTLRVDLLHILRDEIDYLEKDHKANCTSKQPYSHFVELAYDNFKQWYKEAQSRPFKRDFASLRQYVGMYRKTKIWVTLLSLEQNWKDIKKAYDFTDKILKEEV